MVNTNTRYSTIPVYLEPEEEEDQNGRSQEEVSLLKCSPHSSSPFWKRRPCLGIFIAILSTFVITSTTITLYNRKQTQQEAPILQGKKNVIMMISDGFGPASETFARQYYTWLGNRSVTTMLPLDEIHIGHSRTQSSSSLITDSAAGATAFACAKKSYNGAIGVDPHEIPCGTVLESAKIHQDMLTGLVVTSRVTHATPAAFSSHVAWRDWEPLIAEQQIGFNPLGRTVDLMFGGGRCEFTRNSSANSCRADDRDLFQEAQDKFQWNIILSKEEYDQLNTKNVQLPLMALFSSGHMDYEMDRKPNEQPALHEMTRKALDILKAKSEEQDKGFFLMIEGSRIDMAAHNNDPAAHFHEILEYQRTAALVKEFVENNPNTVMISTSDHETGGLTAGRQVGEDYPEYLWYPERLSHVANSSEALAFAWDMACHKKDVDEQTNMDYLREILIRAGLGIHDATIEEIEKIKGWITANKTVYDLAYMFSDMTSQRALIGWTTHGHTAVDVNLYAMGPETEALRGSHENIEIGEFISKFLGLDLDDVTKRLVDGR
ncbi:alkaline-phosphatase-like protein [Mycotypha africana]|uniref:alkaline-phosphatase-like protein n=1 Tax=Mycotypha africana TaxID=64632 RepID=UPI00230000CF|nr:alkaline-phosphatase-like protein [Mycotypha africana]KAI8977219.1 alkaline-phosphatase-like protein [Mycotypha africana]